MGRETGTAAKSVPYKFKRVAAREIEEDAELGYPNPEKLRVEGLTEQALRDSRGLSRDSESYRK